MKIKDLKETIKNLSDNAEVIIHRDADSNYYVPYDNGKIGELDACYFGGEEPKSAEPSCLIITID
jgi:ABC-type xylose transport system substrate-binding protein